MFQFGVYLRYRKYQAVHTIQCNTFQTYRYALDNIQNSIAHSLCVRRTRCPYIGKPFGICIYRWYIANTYNLILGPHLKANISTKVFVTYVWICYPTLTLPREAKMICCDYTRYVTSGRFVGGNVLHTHHRILLERMWNVWILLQSWCVSELICTSTIRTMWAAFNALTL